MNGRQTAQAWRTGARQAMERAGNPDASWDADWMLCEALSCSRTSLRWKGRDVLTDAQKVRLDGWLNERLGGRPLQYVLGNTCFMGLDFHCDERALIPRQDTETLVELALERMTEKRVPRVLDLCTGTGAIGLSVKHYKRDACVTLSDISLDALALARENAQALGLDVGMRQGDLWDAVRGETFDFVLSNPPYLTEKDMDELMEEVRHEPELALRGGADGLDFYRRIADGLNEVLAADGEVLLEIGMGQEDDVIALLNERGFEARAHRDLCGINRVIHARRKNENV